MTPSTNGKSTPFLDVSSFELPELELDTVAEAESFSFMGSPFISSYAYNESEVLVDSEAEEYAEFLSELYDEEFNDALFEIAAEAAEVYETFMESEYGNTAAYQREAMRRLEAHFEPLIAETENMLESMASAADQHDMRRMSEPEIEAFIDRFAPKEGLAPQFEDWGWFKKLKKLAKKVVKKGVSLAKKGLKVAARLGLGPILGRLKRYIKPLLQRVLKWAINKLPAQYRPLARRLAKRLPFLNETEIEEALALPQYDVEIMQYEFNVQLANLIFSDNEAQLDMEVASYERELDEAEDAVAQLAVARERFIQQLGQLEEGEDPTPYVENFIPAMLPLLKLGLKLAGRGRVVGFLARLVAKLIGRFVGPRYARPLSRAIVEAGLRLFHLETSPEDELQIAHGAVASTIEDMVRQMGDLPEYILDNESLLEAYAIEAFEKAAARNLPQMFSEETYLRRPDLRQERKYRGAWVAMPLRRRKRYKKFCRVPRVRISPYKARVIKIHRGVPLASFLQDQLGLPPGEEVEAQVYLYEAIPGTTLQMIARNERGVPGLSTANGSAHMLLHPLTREAAGLLLDEPYLGEDMAPDDLANRRTAEPGQRFYFLEIAGARPQMVPAANGHTALRRSSLTLVTLDFPASQVRIRQYLSEADAQSIAVKLRQQSSTGAAIGALNPILQRGLQYAFEAKALKVIHGMVAPGIAKNTALERVPPVLRERFISHLQQTLGRNLSDFFSKQAQGFLKATADPADGVTLKATITNPAYLSQLRLALEGKIDASTLTATPATEPGVTIQVVPGYDPD